MNNNNDIFGGQESFLWRTKALRSALGFTDEKIAARYIFQRNAFLINKFMYLEDAAVFDGLKEYLGKEPGPDELKKLIKVYKKGVQDSYFVRYANKDIGKVQRHFPDGKVDYSVQFMAIKGK